MSTIYRLATEDYYRLETVHDGFKPDPSASIVGVAIENGELIGRIFLLAPAHTEGPWIREDKRGGTLAKRLMDFAESEARCIGIKKLFAYAVNDEIAEYLKRLGYQKWDVQVFQKEI